jgi:hypothetical protein
MKNAFGVDGALFRGKTRTTSHSEDHGFLEHGGTGSFGEDEGDACVFDDFSLMRSVGGLGVVF